MEEVLLYLGKVAFATMAFFFVFRLLFIHSKNFRFNRHYLLGSMIIPFILPLITFTIVRESAPSLAYLGNSSGEFDVSSISVQQGTLNYHLIFVIVYATGLAVVLLRLLAGHIKALLILKKSRISLIENTPLYIYPAEIHPFAFFNQIVLPGSALRNPAFRMILQHEMAHIRKMHWIDNLLSEILCAALWFNPFSWMMKNALKTNLEFQADEKAIVDHDAESYQMALVAMAHHEGIGTFLTAINSSNLKTRIKMMKKKTTGKFAVIRQLMVLPLLTVLVMGLANREVKTVVIEHEMHKLTPIYPEGMTSPGDLSQMMDQPLQNKVTGRVTNPTGEPVSGATVIIQGTTSGTITDNNGNYAIVVGQQDAALIFAMTGYAKQEIGISGRSVIHVTMYPDKSDTDQISINGQNNDTGNQEKIPRMMWQPVKPLYIVNHVEMDYIDHISPDRIESISVLKDQSATSLYGEKGKNGVTIVTLKGEVKPEDNPKGNPLILLNGLASAIDIKDIDPDDIESVNILKGESAILRYGKLAREGAIEITLKEISPQNSLISSSQQLRRFIASEIKYPVAAQQAGVQGRIILFAEFDKDGKLSRISETEPDSRHEILEEVVIVAYQHAAQGNISPETINLLTEESKRIIRAYPRFDIPEFTGKWVKMQFTFILQ